MGGLHGAFRGESDEAFLETLFGGDNLLAGFAADDGLKIADHSGIRMGAEDGAEKIVSGANVGNPVAHGLVDGVF